MTDKTYVDHLTRTSTWLRGLFMVLFYLVAYLVRLLIALIAIFQFVCVLITGKPNRHLLKFGQDLSEYAYQIYRFLTFNIEKKPFPFSEWPGAAPKSLPNPDKK